MLSGSRYDRPFVEYADEVLPKLGVAHNTMRIWVIHLNHIRKYAPNALFSDITPVWLHKFNQHLCGWMMQNSARKVFVFMRRIFNEARKDGNTTLYPFGEWKLPPEKLGPKPYLTLDEVDRLIALTDQKLPEYVMMTLVFFLMECLAGIRHSDWSKWDVERLIDGDSFRLGASAKTGQPVYIPLASSPRLAKVVGIIAQMGIKYDQSNQDANRQLKMIAVLAGIDKPLTTHVGRHTCATLLLEKGFSRESICEVLGVSVKVVDVYAKMTRRKVRMEFERLGGL